MKILEKYFIKKIVITSMSLFLLILFIIIPTKGNTKQLNIIKKNNKSIYLIDNDNYVSKVSCFYNTNSIEEEVKKKMELLSSGTGIFKGIFPNDTKILSFKIDKNNIYLDFNDSFLNIKDKTKVFECITYSLTEIDNIENIYISVNNKMLDNMPLTRNIGINKKYDLNDFNSIDKTIIFFAKNDYLVPITKITNDDKKVKIIIKELKSSVNSLNNLNGYLQNDIELLDYKINDKKMELIFNKLIFENEESKNLIFESIFENYDLTEIVAYNKDKSVSISIKK